MNVYIIYGSPASGKTTYVKRNMVDGDMVIDLDLIKQSISLQSKTDTSDKLLNVAISIRDYLYDLIEYRIGINCDNIWVIASLPKAIDREYIFNKLQANKIIFIEATKEQCIQRALNNNERFNKDLQIVIINRWFLQYEQSPPHLKQHEKSYGPAEDLLFQ